MTSTHLCLYFHVVFGTKERVPSIPSEWRDRLHAYIGGVVRNLGGVAEAVGGTADHVHVLMGLKATHYLSNIMRDMKRSSSEWMQVTAGVRSFAWQEGYDAFTVSASLREAVHKYIYNQEEHHRRRTFQEEYLKFLRRHGVAFEGRYVD